MKRLAVDTATEACSVALDVDGTVVQRWVEAPREHGDRIIGMIDEVLAEGGVARSEIDQIVFGRGPGAFTGVRIAAGLVQGLASALDRPVVPVSTLAALAQGALRRHGDTQVLAAIDARMGEVYWGMYQRDDAGAMAAVDEECVSLPEAVPLPQDGGWAGVGTGWARYPDALARRTAGVLRHDRGHALPEARDMLVLAEGVAERGGAVTASEALPVYLRDRVAERPRQR